MNKIDKFQGQYRFLSNFYIAPVLYDGINYKCSENAYQAAKTTDEHLKKYISTVSAADAKKLGRMISIRPDWEEIKFTVMSDIVLNKFSQNEDLKKLLLETGNSYLEEGNTWNDTYWGVCNGVGKNRLGLVLMRVRDKLRNV